MRKNTIFSITTDSGVSFFCRLVHFCHAEGGGVSRAVFAFAQRRPTHHAVLDRGNLPPFAVLQLTITVVHPTCAKQVAVHEIFAECIHVVHPLALFRLAIIDVGAVGLVLPAVELTVVKFGAFLAGDAAFPSADNIVSVINSDALQDDVFLGIVEGVPIRV